LVTTGGSILDDELLVCVPVVRKRRFVATSVSANYSCQQVAPVGAWYVDGENKRNVWLVDDNDDEKQKEFPHTSSLIDKLMVLRNAK
jgi:hypothetical protein